MPIARTTHQPIRASHIAKAPPPMEPAAIMYPMVVGISPIRVARPRAVPPTMPSMPIRNRAALPRASILHSNAMW